MNEDKHELDFCQHVGRVLEQYNYRRPSDMLLFLLRTGIITRKTILRFMSILEYDKQLKRTKSAMHKRGCKQLAVHFTIANLPISERQVHENLKKRNINFNNSLFVQKTGV